jgi:hypothetical protein
MLTKLILACLTIIVLVPNGTNGLGENEEKPVIFYTGSLNGNLDECEC